MVFNNIFPLFMSINIVSMILFILMLIFLFITIAALGAINKTKQKNINLIIEKKYQDELIQLYQEDINSYEAQIAAAQNDKNQLYSKLEESNNLIKDLELRFTSLKGEEALSEEKIAAAQNTINRLQQEIMDLENKHTNRLKELNELDVKIRNSNEQLESGHLHQLTIEQQLNKMKEDYNQGLQYLQDLHTQIAATNHQLVGLQEAHAAAVKVAMQENEDANNMGWELPIAAKERKLISVIDELSDLYPELTSDFANIEWKRIWLPKIQDLVNREGLDGKTGIYRIIVKDKENCSYVGQAVNIKERWYQHIKKMVGVDSKGNEKLYEYTPDQLKWQVLEEVSERKDLDDRERYWIEFFGCKEFGLNKKK